MVNPVTFLSLKLNVILSSVTSVVPTEITVFPKTSLILALAALDSKLINSSTL